MSTQSIKSMIIKEILQQYPNAKTVLEGFGMHCLGCLASQAETLEEACSVHGIDVQEVIKNLEESKEV